jgi:hypothetical protein
MRQMRARLSLAWGVQVAAETSSQPGGTSQLPVESGTAVARDHSPSMKPHDQSQKISPQVSTRVDVIAQHSLAHTAYQDISKEAGRPCLG